MAAPTYSHERYADLLEKTFETCRKLGALKGGEYSGDLDRLANFRRNGVDCGLPMEAVWRVYAGKHWDAISQYVKDLNEGKTRERLEGLEGRADDLIVYLILFKAMLEERKPAPPAPVSGTNDPRFNQTFTPPAVRRPPPPPKKIGFWAGWLK